MGFWDFLFTNNKAKVKDDSTPIHPMATVQEIHQVDALKVDIDTNINDYIAFDLETTGLNPDTEKIIEVGFVRFKDGQPIGKYHSLVKISSKIPEAASKVNGITDDMLNLKGKEPETVYKEVVDFIGNALSGDTVLVAHNARFDTDFLTRALAKYGYDGEIKYIDTLGLSRARIKGLENYKQSTVAKYFNIVSEVEHRAVSDAEICGNIFANLLKLEAEEQEKAKEKIIKSALNQEEKEIGAVIENILLSANQDISKVRLYKNSANYIDFMWVYTIFKYKLTKKGNYILLPKNRVQNIPLKTEECTKTENDYVNLRVYFENPFELEKISGILVEIFQSFIVDNSVYDNLSKYEKDFLKNAHFTRIPPADILGLIEEAKNRQIKNVNEHLAKQQEAAELEARKIEKKKQKEEEKLRKILEKQKREEEKIRLQKELLDNIEDYSIESIRKIVELAEQSKKRAVIKLDDDGNILTVYESISDASMDVGIAPKTIRDVANGKYKHGAGFCWEYADEYIAKQIL